MKKYKVGIECLSLSLAKRIGMLVVDEVPEIKKFTIKLQEDNGI